MRQVPTSIKLALEDASLPIKKRILMYRRVWNAEQNKYALEAEPVDVTDLLVEAGSIKMALDTDEVDKWDASNVTLTFNNELNCFKEGLKGGLFEEAVLWGSKFVYHIENAGKDAPKDSIAVFTGYVYSSPVFRANGNQIELTITSSLDALEYVSAEAFCQSKTDELAVVVESQSDKDKGKEFATVETGVGYVDVVKYGADLASAQTLSAGNDYEVSDTNEYAKPAAVQLKFTPTAGHKMWLTYRHWHKDMKIEDVVNALLDLAGVEKRNVEKAIFSYGTGATEYEIDLENKNYNIMLNLNEEEQLLPFYNDDKKNTLHLSDCPDFRDSFPCRLPARGYFNITSPYSNTPPLCNLAFLDDKGNGLCFLSASLMGEEYTGFRIAHLVEYLPVTWIYSSKNKMEAIIGVEIFEDRIRIFFDEWDFRKTFGEVCYQDVLYSFPNMLFVEGQVGYMGIAAGGASSECLGWAESCGEVDFSNRTVFYNSIFKKQKDGLFDYKSIRFNFALGESGYRWGRLESNMAVINNGSGEWFYSDGADGLSFSELIPIRLGDKIPSAQPYLRIYYRTNSLVGYQLFENLHISKIISSQEIPVINLSGLTVGEAIAQLAKMVSYEIGFNQDGVFFFRSRQGRYTDVELDPSTLIEVDNHAADVDNLTNRVTVEYGNFKTTVDDLTEGKTHPNSIDTYGVHEKSISDDNFIPADNVDISQAVAKANYDALSSPGYTLQADCRPDLSLELGDKITVCAENTQIADKMWSDYHKFLKLPIWKRVFKVVGIELSFDKRLMTLTLKDVTSASDVPNMEYNGYQAQFPTPLDYKE